MAKDQKADDYETDIALCDYYIKRAKSPELKEAFRKLKYAIIVIYHKEY